RRSSQEENRMFRGSVVSIHIAANRTLPMQPCDEAKAVAGRGFEGDRYFLGVGTFSEAGGAVRTTGRDITLIEIEAMEALARKNLALDAGAARRNIVTRGVPLNHLVGRTFVVGQVLLRGIRLCEPCAHLEALIQPGVLKELAHRGGLRADIV